MKIKCPECEALMVENEEAHICESCDHTIALDEAEALFEDGKLIAVPEEGDVIEEGDAEGEVEPEEYHGFTNKETWASAIVSENEYSIYKQIKVAHKKEKLDEKFLQTLVENAAGVEDDSLFEGVDMSAVAWEEVNEHFKSSMKDSDAISVDVTAALFADVELNEEQKDELVSIFESAVDIRVNDIKGGLLEDHAQKVDEAIEAKEKELEESSAKYIDHVVAEWYDDNEIVIEDSLKVEYAEDFIDKLHDLFQESYVHVPEDRYDIIESLNEKVKSFEKYEAYALKESEKLEGTITEMKKEKSIATLTEGMVETEKEKLAEIADGVDFVDGESFITEVTKLKEAFISKEKTTDIKDEPKKEDTSAPNINDDIMAAMSL